MGWDDNELDFGLHKKELAYITRYIKGNLLEAV